MKSPTKGKRKKSKPSRKAKPSARKKKAPKRARRRSKPAAPKTKKKIGAAKPRAARLAAEALTAPAADPPGMTCSDGWRVTGYYTPAESDCHGAPQQIDVSGHGADSFPSDFLTGVRMEGWGLTRYGWYLGFDAGRYSSADAPQSARGKPLAVGSLAVDKNEIPFGSSVRIPGLPPPWSNQVFVADDVGSMINQKHVDVYCGNGMSARAQTFRITSDSQRLCQKT